MKKFKFAALFAAIFVIGSCGQGLQVDFGVGTPCAIVADCDAGLACDVHNNGEKYCTDDPTCAATPPTCEAPK